MFNEPLGLRFLSHMPPGAPAMTFALPQNRSPGT